MKNKLAIVLLLAFLINGCISTNRLVGTKLDKSVQSDKNNLAILKSLENPIEQNLCSGIPIPKLLKDLNENDVYSSNVSLSINTSLSAYGFTGSMNKKDILTVAYFTKFKDYDCDGITTRAQVGIKLYVHATDLKVKLSSPSLPTVAAAVELGLAKAEYRIQTFGINPDKFYTKLPSAQFNVETYSKVISSYDNIIHSLNDDTPIDPKIVKINKTGFE